MTEKILVPVLGESITEATVSKWLKNEGDIVEADEPIVELETDKVNLEVPSPVSGTLTKINSKSGSVVEVGADLGSVSESETASEKTVEIKKIKPTTKIDFSSKSKSINLEASPQINSLLLILQLAESLPQSLIPLNMNGITLVFNSLLFAFPQTATIPLGFV